MKIDPEHTPRVSKEATPADRLSGGGRAGSANAGAPRRPSGPEAADGVAVSSQGERFRQLRARLAELPEPAADPARVRDLAALVASGRYQVDGSRIAQAVLQDEATAAVLDQSRSG